MQGNVTVARPPPAKHFEQMNPRVAEARQESAGPPGTDEFRAVIDHASRNGRGLNLQ